MLEKLGASRYVLIIKAFIVWRVLLFVFLFLAISILPLQKGYLGGGIINYIKTPHLWSFINFDGEHYFSIAQYGYRPLKYFFFPVYPLVVSYLARLFDGSIVSYALTGLLVSHASFLVGLIGLVKLIRLDYKKEIAQLSVILLMLFPTSFYFASFYTESLFLALVVWSFYFARTKRWIMAGVLGALLTATRVVGLALLPALLMEVWEQRREIGPRLDSSRIQRGKGDLGKAIFGILLVPLGLIAYMIFLKKQTGDPLEFFHSVEVFGEQRSASFILLPQVFYRYIVKILTKINYSYLPIVFTTWLEFITAIVFGILGLLGGLGPTSPRLRGVKKLGWAKMRSSYVVYLIVGYLIPTFSGSFSSLPRYVLVLFPGFILASLYLVKLPKVLQAVVFVLLFVSLGIATMLFARGYWIA